MTLSGMYFCKNAKISAAHIPTITLILYFLLDIVLLDYILD